MQRGELEGLANAGFLSSVASALNTAGYALLAIKRARASEWSEADLGRVLDGAIAVLRMIGEDASVALLPRITYGQLKQIKRIELVKDELLKTQSLRLWARGARHAERRLSILKGCRTRRYRRITRTVERAQAFLDAVEKIYSERSWKHLGTGPRCGG